MPSNEGSFCYHCYAVGNCVDECPECAGKPWSEEFLTAKAEIDEELANRRLTEAPSRRALRHS